MSDTTKTKEQQRQREQRIIEHARAGHTMTEIVDMEGLDRANVKRWHKVVRDAGVVITTGRESRPPVGLTKETETWRYRLGRKLNRLRDEYPQIEVSRMVGMTNTEINAATNTKVGPQHDWTIGQLTRLAAVLDTTVAELIKETM